MWYLGLVGVLASTLHCAHAGDSPTWNASGPVDSDVVFHLKSLSDKALYSPFLEPRSHEIALKDNEERIHPNFRVQEPFKPLVSFWLRIYTEFSSRQSVVFDRNHPEIVYEVMDFQELHKNSRNEMAYEIVRERRIEKRIKEYRAAFARLSRIPAKSLGKTKLSPLESKILASIRSSSHSQLHNWAIWNKALRVQTGQRDMVIRGLMVAEYYLPRMEEIFKQLNVPSELTRISLVESSFNLKAHSKSGAKGVWQFMLASGKEYMRVDPAGQIDERISPMKSTVAAARLLTRNLRIAGNWPLAITAYHHGYTGIRKLSPSERSTALDGSLFLLCQKKRKTLGYASSNYYAEFLAMLHAEAYKDLFYGEIPLPVAPEMQFQRLSQPIVASKFAMKSGMSIADFRRFNPDVLNMQTTLPKGFFVATAADGDRNGMKELIASIRAKVRYVRRASLDLLGLSRKAERVSSL